ncbi:MAG: phytanoyl-CoA dioxygenase family protein [Trueperaceae bacterium]|nr:MAG: phytanoyl-CoA dioxygenase family protein [Trueperaceae bacterium]
MTWQDRPEQLREDFNRDGYVALRGFLSDAEVAEVHQNLERLIAEVLPTLPRAQVFFEDKDDPGTLKQIQRLFEHDAYFAKLFFGSAFERLAEILLGGGVEGKNMQYFNKPPRIGQATPPHQDGYYFMLEPCEALTMWLALDDVDEENGCVRYVRASNHGGMRSHGRTQTLGFSQGITDYGTAEDLEKEVAFPARPGDLLVHHAMTIHRADGNRSASRSRRALGFIYYSERAKEDKLAHAAYQKRLAEEMVEAGKI